MDRSWIRLKDRFCQAYIDGVREFLTVAQSVMNENGKIRCPCRKCQNTRFGDLDYLQKHLFTYGISRTYDRWVFHGEEPDLSIYMNNPSTSQSFEMPSEQPECSDEVYEMINDLQGNRDGVDQDNVERSDDQMFQTLLNEAKQELYPGCSEFSSLNFLVKLMHIKVLNNMTNKAMDMILQLLKQALPVGSVLPESFYAAKRILKDLGLGYNTIDACRYDCILFRKDYASFQYCPVCGESRYKINTNKGKKVPNKILRHFPLKLRLQRLFSSTHTASEMRWHREKRVDTEGILRHPADAAGWKHFDDEFPWFAADPRNVRLALASDGFNPYGNMSTQYSMWPVVLVPYNLPPWKCMKEQFFMMSTLIPGPKSPGREIDIYLEPLMEELKELWTEGIRTFDCSRNEYFQLHAALLWTINDFPAYGDLSGWSTKGYKACPICQENTSSMRLTSKICYMGHRRYLPPNHNWRRSRLHDGRPEVTESPPIKTGDEIIAELDCLQFPSFGKNPSPQDKRRKQNPSSFNWKKRSIFFCLPYWSKLLIRHKLDVMHIEKNICDNLVGTLLNIDGKSKDTFKARLDLANLKIRKELHIQKIGNRYFKPHASYTLTAKERIEVCKFLKSMKFPDGFASNISRCVNVGTGKISGLKTHDCHVLLQRILPIAIRGFISTDICAVVTEMGNFFRSLCGKILKVEDLEQLQMDIVIILCKMERIFPPAFFDVMIHLAVHLPYEAKLVGPVGYSWMYPIERYLKTLKQYVRNKARPEGSIAEAYIVNESLTFCSMYLRGIETRFNRDDRNDDTYECESSSQTKFSVFKSNGRPIGA